MAFKIALLYTWRMYDKKFHITNQPTNKQKTNYLTDFVEQISPCKASSSSASHKNSPHLMETNGLLPRSWEPATCPCLEQYESSPHPPTLFL